MKMNLRRRAPIDDRGEKGGVISKTKTLASKNIKTKKLVLVWKVLNSAK